MGLLRVNLKDDLQIQISNHASHLRQPESAVIAKALNCFPAHEKVRTENPLKGIIENIKKPEFKNALRMDKAFCWAMAGFTIMFPLSFMASSFESIIHTVGFVLGCFIGLRFDVIYFSLFVKKQKTDRNRYIESKVRMYDPVAAMVSIENQVGDCRPVKCLMITGPLAEIMENLSARLGRTLEETVNGTLRNYLAMDTANKETFVGNLCWLGVWGLMVVISIEIVVVSTSQFIK